MEDTSEVGPGKKPFESGGDEETQTSRHLDSPLKLLQTQPQCEVYPDLRKIIQVSWSGNRPKVGSRALRTISPMFPFAGEVHGRLLAVLQARAV